MRTNFEACLAVTLKFEGGYSNNPKDPGGATNKGVTQHTFDAFRQANGRPKADVRHIADDEVSTLYRTLYWLPVGCEGLPAGVDLLAFDIAVNSGQGRAKQWLAECAGRLPGDRIRYLDDRRRSFWKALKTFATFGRGWMARENAVFAAALRMQAPRVTTAVKA